MRPYKDSMSVGTGWATFRYEKEYDYHEGEIKTRHGIVTAYMQGSDEHPNITRLDFVIDGRCHMWSWDRRYKPQYVITLAKRMAATLQEQDNKGLKK